MTCLAVVHARKLVLIICHDHMLVTTPHCLFSAKQQLIQNNNMQVQQMRYTQLNRAGGNLQASGILQNGTGGVAQEDRTNEQRAALVHGTLNNNPDEGLIRRPQRLEALNPQASKKSKKKRNVLEPI